MKALSIRQPWAWLIVHGPKDIENRTGRTKYRGPLLIHASAGMTRCEYYHVAGCIELLSGGHSVDLPPMEELQRGGIVGSAEITACVSLSFSPWFMGPNGFVLANRKPLPFAPLKGKLGFFEVTP
jgi:hypothetical protein